MLAHSRINDVNSIVSSRFHLRISMDMLCPESQAPHSSRKSSMIVWAWATMPTNCTWTCGTSWVPVDKGLTKYTDSNIKVPKLATAPSVIQHLHGDRFCPNFKLSIWTCTTNEKQKSSGWKNTQKLGLQHQGDVLHQPHCLQQWLYDALNPRWAERHQVFGMHPIKDLLSNILWMFNSCPTSLHDVAWKLNLKRTSQTEARTST